MHVDNVEATGRAAWVAMACQTQAWSLMRAVSVVEIARPVQIVKERPMALPRLAVEYVMTTRPMIVQTTALARRVVLLPWMLVECVPVTVQLAQREECHAMLTNRARWNGV